MTKLNILQQNVACHWFSRYDPPTYINRLTAIAENIRLNQIDICNIQELYTFNLGLFSRKLFSRNTELSVFTNALQLQGIQYQVPNHSFRNAFGMDLGLRIFSRYPIKEYTLRPFVHQDQIKLPITTKKGFLDAEIEINGKLIGVINIHMAAKIQSVRNEQLIELINYITINSDKIFKREFTLIMGDFNMTMKSFMDLQNLLPEGESTHHYLNRQIDNVFIKTKNPLLINIKIVDWKTSTGEDVSDHKGIVINLDFK